MTHTHEEAKQERRDFDKLLTEIIQQLATDYNVNYFKVEKIFTIIIRDHLINSLNSDERVRAVIDCNLRDMEKLKTNPGVIEDEKRHFKSIKRHQIRDGTRSC